LRSRYWHLLSPLAMRREHSSLKDDGRDTCFTNPIFHAEQGSRRMLEGTIWRLFLPSRHWTCRTQPPVPLRQLPIKMALTNCSGGWSAKPTGLGGTSHPWIGLAWHYLTTLTHRSPTQGASRVPPSRPPRNHFPKWRNHPETDGRISRGPGVGVQGEFDGRGCSSTSCVV